MPYSGIQTNILFITISIFVLAVLTPLAFNYSQRILDQLHAWRNEKRAKLWSTLRGVEKIIQFFYWSDFLISELSIYSIFAFIIGVLVLCVNLKQELHIYTFWIKFCVKIFFWLLIVLTICVAAFVFKLRREAKLWSRIVLTFILSASSSVMAGSYYFVVVPWWKTIVGLGILSLSIAFLAHSLKYFKKAYWKLLLCILMFVVFIVIFLHLQPFKIYWKYTLSSKDQLNMFILPLFAPFSIYLLLWIIGLWIYIPATWLLRLRGMEEFDNRR